MSKGDLDFSGLSHLSEAQKKGAWSPLTPADLHPGYGLFYDQSLTNTGWVELLVTPEHVVRVVNAGMIKPQESPGLTGFALDFARGNSIFAQIFKSPRLTHSDGYDVVAIETPPIGFKVKGDGTSSKLAGQAIINAYAFAPREVVLIQSQAAKKTMTGKGAKVTKAEAHAAMRLHCFGWVEGTEKVTNEHTRDALMNGLHWFSRAA